MKLTPFTKNQSTKNDLLGALIEPLEVEVIKQKEYLQKTNELFLSYVERINRVESKNSISKSINETIWLEGELFSQLETEFPSKEDSLVHDFYSSFLIEFDKVSKEIPEIETVEQDAERFKIQTGDTFKIKLQKPFKNFLFKLSRIPLFLRNLFAKEKKANKYWSRKVPLKAMCQHYFESQLLLNSLPHFKELQKLKCDSRSIKWSINKDINSEVSALLDKDDISFDDLKAHLLTMSQQERIKESIADFDRKLSIWKKENEQHYDRLLGEFERHAQIAGTIELNNDRYSATNLENEKAEYSRQYNTILNGWRNTQYAQIDDFQIDLELYLIKYNGLMQYYLLQNGCNNRINLTVEQNIYSIKSEITSVIDQINQTRSINELKDLLISERIKLKHQLGKKSIPKAISALYENNFPNLIERLEQKIRAQVNGMKGQRIIYSKETYDAPIPKSNLSHFNPRELVEADLINPFSDSLLQLKTQIIAALQLTEEGLTDLVEIIDYNLDAARNSTEGELSLEEIKNIASDGLARAGSKTEGIETELRRISLLLQTDCKLGLNKLNTNLLKLTVNENITNLRIKLAKAKALNQTEAYKKELLNKVRNFVPIFIRFSRQRWSNLIKISVSFQETIGLLDTKKTLSSELSDFLSQTESAIQKLPFVYRRLYEIKPLEEEAFFEGRKKELEKLDEAFKRWKESNISSAVIIGEKGSGTSSMLNLFSRKHEEETIIRYQLTKTIYRKNEFLDFFDTLFPKQNLNSFESIVSFLNEGNKKIIILEDIQFFYLKKPHGFEAMNLLFELISQTNKTIFWVIGTTTFTWKYLQKTITIERYIKYKIELTPLTKEQIVNLIMSRHRVSGYNLRFENIIPERKGFQLLTNKKPDLSQENLKKLFFEELNHFAESNISLALLYWLRSTISFEENTVVIGKIKNINFDFLTTLDAASIFTLHALLLHESLTVSEHATVFNQEDRQSRMTLMVLEDSGILKSHNGLYTINQLIYRQVVNVLKSKNLIH